MDRRKFITTCTCCACASMGAMLLNGYNKTENPADDSINYIEIHLAEHCNLGCKYCLHYSCIAEKEFYDLDKFNQDIKLMSDIFNGQLGHLQLLGGEPLLNPQILEYVKTSRQCFQNSRISIVTNGVLLDDMDEKFWKTLNDHNIVISLSVYPIDINLKSILNKSQKYNVPINICINPTSDPKQNKDKCTDMTADNMHAALIQYFFKLPLSETKYRNRDKSKCIRRICNLMYDGKIYLCPTIAHIRHLNKKFNTNFLITEKDYLDLYKVKNVKQVRDFLYHTKKFPFCEYCSAEYQKVKWETSLTHDISEWT